MRSSAVIQPDTDMAAGHYARLLTEEGYCIIPELVAATRVAALAGDLGETFGATPASEGPFYGNGTRRFGALLKRSPHAAAFVQHALILDIVDRILGPWCDHFLLNLTQAIEIMPASIEQVPHRDQDMWPCSRLIAPEHAVEFLINVMWPFTPYTAANGATRVWPGSHRRQGEPLLDPADAIPAEMEPGSALLFLGSTLHAGGANRTRHPRRGMIVSYSLGWLKPYELQWLAYPPEVAKHFSPELAALAGYRVHRPNLGNVEGRCPSALLEAPSGKPLGAVDALGPDQEALIDQFRAGTLTFEGERRANAA
jgi:ectoine hydroxylase-related dioxygenase (phytanoyl-CoA dioxygenase family)